MITDRYPLSGYREAFERLLSVPKQAYKVVFTPAELRPPSLRTT
jgi:hypothetical protein